MADDELFSEDGNEDGTGEAAPTGEATAPAATSEMIAEAVSKAMGPIAEQLGTTVENLNVKMNSIEQGLQPPPADTPPPDFYGDPAAAVQAQVEEAVRNATGPLFQTLLSDKYNSMVKGISAEVDTEFGEGVYTEEFETDLQNIIKDLPANFRASEAHVRSALDGLIGAKRDTMWDKKAEQTKKREETDSRSGVGYTGLGSGRPTPKTGRLTGEEKDFVAMVAKHNPGYDEKQYIASKDKGNTSDDWPREGKTNAD